MSLFPLLPICSITPSVPLSAPSAFPPTAVQAPLEKVITSAAVGAEAMVPLGLADLVVWQQQMPSPRKESGVKGSVSDWRTF